MHTNHTPPREARKHPRFPLSFPVRLRFGGKGVVQELETVSRNVSIAGVLLETPTPLPADCPVDFVMSIQSAGGNRQIRVKGSGRVVRVEQYASGIFGVAVKCSRPIHRILNVTGLEGN